MDDDSRGLRAALRRPRPDGWGSRLALGVAVAALAAVVGLPVGLGLAQWAYGAGRLCPVTEDFACAVVGGLGVVVGVLAVTVVGAAWYCRLGWRWWLTVLSALPALALVLALDPWSPWLVLPFLLPVAAAFLSEPTLPWWRVRTGVVVLLAVSMTAAFVGALLLAMG